MLKRLLLAGTIAAALITAPGLAANAPAQSTPPQSPPDTRVIAADVSAGGVAIGGMTVDQATSTLTAQLTAPLTMPIVVGASGHVYRLTPAQAKFSFDARRTAQRAYEAGAAAPSARTAPLLVPLAVAFSQKSVDAFVANAALHSFHPARDAFVQVTMAHLYPRHDHDGSHLDAPALRRAIAAAFASPAAPRVLHEALVRDRAHVTYAGLAHRYATVVTVDRSTFKLRLFKYLRLVKTYPVAVGRVGLATPAGEYHVLDRQVNPSWHVPHDSWAGSLQGQTIPPGPGDPLVARWLGLGNGIGIHGTNEPFSIGGRASHGCIRMLPSDVIALYPRVPLGTPVYIH